MWSDEKGYLVLLNEEQFFDILEGRAELPPRKKNPRTDFASYKQNFQEEEKKYKLVRQDALNRKRLDNLAKYGVVTPDGARIKIEADMRLLYKARRAAELVEDGRLIKGSEDYFELHEILRHYSTKSCTRCKGTIIVNLSGRRGGNENNLCPDCYNRLMAGMTGKDFMKDYPKYILLKSKGGRTQSLLLPL